MKKNIILWSTSPRRKDILSILEIPFEIIASDYEEDMSLQSTMSSTDLAMFLSKWKGDSIIEKLSKNSEKAIVISADTFISFNNACIGKPFTQEKQRELLHRFSGQTLQIITGVYIVDMYEQKIYNESIAADVCFKNLSEEQIERYIWTNEWLDRAGWFAAQWKWNILIDHIYGDWYNILGLPLSRVYDILQECNAFA